MPQASQTHLRSKKGQVAVELFIALGIVLFLFLTLVLLGIDKEAKLALAGENMDRRDVCIAFQTAISSVYSGGPGTEYNLSVSLEEDIIVYNNTIWVGDVNLYSCPTPVNIGATVNLVAGQVQFTNIDNNVSIQNV